MKAVLLLIGALTLAVTGCRTYDYDSDTMESGDVMVEPAGADISDLPMEEPRDIHQREYGAGLGPLTESEQNRHPTNPETVRP